MFSAARQKQNQALTQTNNSKEFFFQPKLTVNQPNDVYEQEADTMADKVMNMQQPANTSTFFSPQNIQRKCAACEEEDKNVQRKENNNAPESLSIPNKNQPALMPGGNTLSNAEKTFFGSRMGYDFSDVRIHYDANANQSAKNINALAYTHGHDIVFAKDQYQPNTDEGKKLMAHELTHVIQQSKNDISLKHAPEMIQRQADKDPSELDDETLQSEYDAYNEYVHQIDPADYVAEEEAMTYFNALEKELKKRCIKSKPVHPEKVSDKLIDRITGKYEMIDGDPGEGKGFYKPYLAAEGQCTVGYGHVIFPKTDCVIDAEKKTCTCADKWNLKGEADARYWLRKDLQNHVNEVNKKIKVDLNQAEFDAMVDLSAHKGSMPADFAKFANENWCTNKEAVRDLYLRTAITMKNKLTGEEKVMQNFIDRRRRRAW